MADDPTTLDLRQQTQPPAGGAAPPAGGVAPPAGGAAPLTLNVSDASPGISLIPYGGQIRAWDKVRQVVAIGLLVILAWVVVWSCIESASWKDHWAQTKEMLQTILPAITGLIGSVIGFYFGSGSNSSSSNSNSTNKDKQTR